MSTLSTNNFTTCECSFDIPAVPEDDVRALLHWLATREILPDYARAESRSFTTLDIPFGIQETIAAKMDAHERELSVASLLLLDAGCEDARSGRVTTIPTEWLSGTDDE